MAEAHRDWLKGRVETVLFLVGFHFSFVIEATGKEKSFLLDHMSKIEFVKWVNKENY